MEERNPADLVRETVVLNGRVALDVGCSDAAFLAFLAGCGAFAVGVNVHPPAPLVDRSEAIEIAIPERAAFVCGAPMALPFADRSIGVVLLLNLLSRLHKDDQRSVLTETHRVLSAGGHVFALEALAEGPYFELLNLVEDDAARREQADAAIRDCGPIGLHAVADHFFDSPAEFADAAEFRRHLALIKPTLDPAVTPPAEVLDEAFQRLSLPRGDQFLLRRPVRVNILQRL